MMPPETKPPPLVSIIMIFLDEERFIGEAVASVFAQSWPHWELILVDDGSSDRSTAIARRVASENPERVLYVHHSKHQNRGMSASRNLGLEHASGSYIAFLDADDVYLPDKLTRQVAVLEEHPDAGLVYGATEYWYSWERGSRTRRDRTWNHFGVPTGRLIDPPELLATFLGDGGTLPCMGSLMVRHNVVEAAGRFEERFRGLFEDQAFLAKTSLSTPTIVLPECLDRYRQHDTSACATATSAELARARAAYLAWLEEYLARTGVRDPNVLEALHRAMSEHKTSAQPEHSPRIVHSPFRGFLRVLHVIGKWRFRLEQWRRKPRPRPGWVRFGSLRRTTPVSRIWGRDRGRSLDRYYIEGFLEEHREDIRGRVLEVGDSHYTRTFGGDRVTMSDVLHVDEGNPEATVIADLASAPHIPDDTFDCIILTQTLQLIFDVPAAIRTVHRILKPGGVLLATFPGITHTGDADWQEHWCWSFTTTSARLLFHRVFGEDRVEMQSYGNVLAATAFLYGLADSELRRDELDYHDPSYNLVIAIRATHSLPETP